MVLAGDIGGTKVNLALYILENDELKLITQSQFASKDFDTFDEVVEDFKKTNSLNSVDSVCIGVAGPVLDGRCKITNLSWDIKEENLKKQLNTSKVKLINDLEATAYGMLYLKDEDFIDLNVNAEDKKGNIAVIAAGTGLGEGFIFYDGENYHPIATEGGHTDFAPISPLQDELLSWLRLRHPSHVSYERIVCGGGIYTIYEFLVEKNFAPIPEVMKNIAQGVDKSAVISKCALEDKDPLCIKTLKIFCEIYATEAGNLALKSMSLGGVYIGGGISPKILPFIQSKDFFDNFVRKGRFEPLLKKMKLKLSLNDKTALLGSARYAFDKLL
jgi:glucokinase